MGRTLSLSRLALAAQACLVLSCASQPTPEPARPVPPAARVAMSVWHTLTLTDNGYGCAPWWIEPQVLCSKGKSLGYDGCHWRCFWTDMSGAPQ